MPFLSLQRRLAAFRGLKSLAAPSASPQGPVSGEATSVGANSLHIPSSIASPKPAILSPGPHRVLYVEDDLNTLSGTSELLTMLGHTVTPAASAEAALEALLRSPVDVLLTDVTLPGLSGVDLAREAERLHPSLPIIFASGYGAKLELPPDLVGHAILPKPFDLGQLEALLAGGS